MCPNPNQPVKHSIAHVGELKATFSTMMSDDRVAYVTGVTW